MFKYIAAALMLMYASNTVAFELVSPTLQGPQRRYLSETSPSSAPTARLLDEKDTLKPWTIGIMVGVAVGLIAWDVIAAAHHSATESQILSHTAWNYSSVPFAVGVLCGHWFFNIKNGPRDLYPYTIATAVLMLTWDLLRGDAGKGTWIRHPAIWFTFGVGMGALTWGQTGDFGIKF